MAIRVGDHVAFTNRQGRLETGHVTRLTGAGMVDVQLTSGQLVRQPARSLSRVRRNAGDAGAPKMPAAFQVIMEQGWSPDAVMSKAFAEKLTRYRSLFELELQLAREAKEKQRQDLEERAKQAAVEGDGLKAKQLYTKRDELAAFLHRQPAEISKHLFAKLSAEYKKPITEEQLRSLLPQANVRQVKQSRSQGPDTKGQALDSVVGPSAARLEGARKRTESEMRREESYVKKAQEKYRSFLVDGGQNIFEKIQQSQAMARILPDPVRTNRSETKICGNVLDGMAYTIAVSGKRQRVTHWLTYEDLGAIPGIAPAFRVQAPGSTKTLTLTVERLLGALSKLKRPTNDRIMLAEGYLNLVPVGARGLSGHHAVPLTADDMVPLRPLEDALKSDKGPLHRAEINLSTLQLAEIAEVEPRYIGGSAPLYPRGAIPPRVSRRATGDIAKLPVLFIAEYGGKQQTFGFKMTVERDVNTQLLDLFRPFAEFSPKDRIPYFGWQREVPGQFSDWVQEGPRGPARPAYERPCPDEAQVAYLEAITQVSYALKRFAEAGRNMRYALEKSEDVDGQTLQLATIDPVGTAFVEPAERDRNRLDRAVKAFGYAVGDVAFQARRIQEGASIAPFKGRKGADYGVFADPNLLAALIRDDEDRKAFAQQIADLSKWAAWITERGAAGGVLESVSKDIRKKRNSKDGEKQTIEFLRYDPERTEKVLLGSVKRYLQESDDGLVIASAKAREGGLAGLSLACAAASNAYGFVAVMSVLDSFFGTVIEDNNKRALLAARQAIQASNQGQSADPEATVQYIKSLKVTALATIESHTGAGTATAREALTRLVLFLTERELNNINLTGWNGKGNLQALQALFFYGHFGLNSDLLVGPLALRQGDGVQKEHDNSLNALASKVRMTAQIAVGGGSSISASSRLQRSEKKVQVYYTYNPLLFEVTRVYFKSIYTDEPAKRFRGFFEGFSEPAKDGSLGHFPYTNLRNRIDFVGFYASMLQAARQAALDWENTKGAAPANDGELQAAWNAYWSRLGKEKMDSEHGVPALWSTLCPEAYTQGRFAANCKALYAQSREDVFEFFRSIKTMYERAVSAAGFFLNEGIHYTGSDSGPGGKEYAAILKEDDAADGRMTALLWELAKPLAVKAMRAHQRDAQTFFEQVNKDGFLERKNLPAAVQHVRAILNLGPKAPIVDPLFEMRREAARMPEDNQLRVFRAAAEDLPEKDYERSHLALAQAREAMRQHLLREIDTQLKALGA